MTPTNDETLTILLVNKEDNPDAKINLSERMASWNWIEAPPDWKPEEGASFCPTPMDLIIVFARKYAEEEALRLCTAIRQCPAFDGTPLVAAISMYQMPLGNDVKRLPYAGTIFTPVREKHVLKRLREMTPETGPQGT